MSILNDKRAKFIRIVCLITICFQLAFCFFYSQLPFWLQVILFSSIPGVLLSLILLQRFEKYRTAAFVYLSVLFIHQTTTFYFLSQGPRINIGAALMMGTLSIIGSVLLGLRWGIFFTVLVILLVSSELYFLPFDTTFSNNITYKNLYTFLSILEPGIIINYLSFYFYHTLAEEAKDKKEIKFRLEKVLDNSLQTVVLIDKNKKILYADVKSRELAKQYINMEIKNGDDAYKYIFSPLQSSFNENLDKAFKGEKITLERRVDVSENVVLWFLVMYSPLYDFYGKVDTVQFSLIDISAQKLVQQELQKAEERWKYALTSSQDGVWDWSVKDGKAYFSRMWKEMLGYADDEIENSFAAWEKLIHPEDKQKSFEGILKHVKNQTENYVLEHRLLQKNGQYLWILARGKIIERDEHGNPVRFIGTHTDIDHIKKVEQDLKSAQEKAEQAAEAKSQFLSTISHEIRTPLNAVIGFSNLLLRENADSQNDEYLQNIQTSANHLLSLVNNVLDISKIESGKIEFEKRDFDLEKLLEENISMLSLRAKEKVIELKIGHVPNLQYYLSGDPFRLTQILNNLLGNAVKFTDKGFVELNVDVISENEKQIELRFSVKDTGTGIPRNKIDTIFESFSQASTETARKYGGTGLGLSISKHLVNLQGGNMGVESRLHDGSTFYFNLTFVKGKTLKNTEAKRSEEKEDNLDGLKVLVAEDNIFNTKVLTRFLDLWNVEYLVAENGEKVLELLSENSFDLILMDLHMPQMDGYEATRKIREAGNHIYIMALTASANFSSKEEMKQKGFDSYSIKPINTKELYKKLKEIHSKHVERSSKNS